MCAVQQAFSDPQIGYQVTDDGNILFQIRGDKNPPHELSLIELGHSEPTIKLSAFEPSPVLKNTFTALWTPGEQTGVYELHGKAFDGKEFTWERKALTRPFTLDSVRADLNRRDGRVTWTPRKSSIVRVNAGLEGGMFIKTLRPWHFSNASTQTEEWDFWDHQGVAEYRNSRRVGVYARAIDLPSDLVVVGSPSYERYQDHPRVSGMELDTQDYYFSVQPFKKNASGNQNVASLLPNDPIRITLNNDTDQRLARDRYEYLFFLNGEFIHEETEGSSPYTFRMPMWPEMSGVQLLTVNIKSYSGGVGSTTVPLNFQIPSKELKPGNNI